MNPELVANLIIQGCDDSERTIRAAVAGAPRVVSFVINHHPALILASAAVKSSIIQMILDAINDAADLLLQAVAAFRFLAESMGSPTALRTSAATLQTSVQSANTLTGAMLPSALLGLQPQYWDSVATATYASGLTDQTRAADGLANIFSELAKMLEDMATSIETFYSDLASALIGLVLAVVGFCVGIPSGAATMGIGTVVGIIIGVIGILQALWAIVSAATSAGDRNYASAQEMLARPAVEWKASVFAS